MNDLDFTLLEKKDIEGTNKLSILDKYGTRAAITDFAILLGGFVSNAYHMCEGNNLKDRAGVYFAKTDDKNKNALAVYFDGTIVAGVYTRNQAVSSRPLISYSSIIKESSSERINNMGVYEVEYGEYPQTIENEGISNELEELYANNILNQTGKKYTTNSITYESLFESREHIEYEYNGEKYIRILGDYSSKGKTLSDGRIVEEEKPYFVKVEPIVWLVDKNRDIAITKKLLFAGVQFDGKNYYGNFNSTNMHYFLKNHFSKDIIPSKIQTSKLYLVNFSDEKEKYYPAYEVEDILRELYTNIELIPEDANFFKEDALKYYSKKTVDELTYYSYMNAQIENDSKKHLDYLFEICILGGNEELYTLYEEEYKKQEVLNKVYEQKKKLTLK